MVNPEAGINRFAVSTPTKERRTDTPVLPKTGIKPIPAFPQPDKQPRIKRLVKSLAGRIALATLVVGGGVAVEVGRQFKDIPALSRPAETVAPFDPKLLDKQPQILVPGVNAREATPEDIQNAIEGPRPKIVTYRSVEAGEDIPKIPLILSIGPEAGTVKIYRKPSPVGMNGKSVDIPMNLRISVENDGARFGPIIPEGINTNEGELFISKGLSREIDGKLYFTAMYIKFKFGDGQYIIITIGNNAPNSFLATDFLKNAPFIDENKPKYGSGYTDIMRETGKKFNISENPALFIKTAPEDINIHVSSATEDLKGYSMLPEPKVTNGSFLMNPPR